jgi:Fe-S cluster assembly protein SufD
MKPYLYSQSPSVYSTLSQNQQVVRIKSRTHEELELGFSQESPETIQLHISDSAQVYLKLQTLEPTTRLRTLECFLSKGSLLYIEESYQQSLNLSIKVHFTEPYSSANIKTRIQAGSQSQISLNQHILHRAGYTQANLEGRAVVSDQAKVNIDTTLRVDPGAKGCTTLQSFAGLQLSAQSQIKAVPRLEIYHSDVMTKHGVSIRTIRPEEVWYLSSRGLTEEQARDIITAGFIT